MANGLSFKVSTQTHSAMFQLFSSIKSLFVQSQKNQLTVAVAVFSVKQPIPIALRMPSGSAWFGWWDESMACWHWGWLSEPDPEDTHWLPGSVDVLPVTCFVPEIR